jgi:hypothetical protein
MDRMVAAPVWRGALNLGSVLQAVIQILNGLAVLTRQRESLIGAVTWCAPADLPVLGADAASRRTGSARSRDSTR